MKLVRNIINCEAILDVLAISKLLVKWYSLTWRCGTHNLWFSVGFNSCFPKHAFLSFFRSRRQQKDWNYFSWHSNILFYEHSPIPPLPFLPVLWLSPWASDSLRWMSLCRTTWFFLVYSVAAFYLSKFNHTEKALKSTITVRKICTCLYLNVFVEAWIACCALWSFAFQPQ